VKLKFLKLVAWFVIFTFTLTSFNPVSFAAAPELPSVPFKTLEIPAEFGQVTDTLFGDPNAPAFIHIQSAHGNYQAEKNIEKLLGYIEKNSKVRLMLLEGATEKLQPELFRIFPKHPDFNRKVTDKLMREGYLTGPERFLIEGATDNAQRATKDTALTVERCALRGFGIEDLEAYKKDREAFISVVKKEKTAEKFLGSLRVTIDKRFSSKVNKDLLNLVRQEESLGSGITSFESWLKSLGEAGKKALQLDLSDAFQQAQYPFLVRYYKLQEIGSKIDRDAAMKEADSFIKELEKRKITKDIIDLFKQEAQRSTVNGQRDVARCALRAPQGYSPLRLAFDRAFTKLPRDFSMKPWPAFTLYAQHQILLEEMESKGLQEETVKLKDQVLTALAQTPAEKEYLAEARQLYLLRRLFSLELTRGEYEELKGLRSQGHKPQGHTCDMWHVACGKSKVLQSLFMKAIAFYETAVLREQKMFANSLSRMAEQKQDRAVIVTGGFHAEGLKTLARERNCSYLQITPRITEISKRDHEIYLRSILGARDLETSQMSGVLGTVRAEVRDQIIGKPAAMAWRSEVRKIISNSISLEPVADQTGLRAELRKQTPDGSLQPAAGATDEIVWSVPTHEREVKRLAAQKPISLPTDRIKVQDILSLISIFGISLLAGLLVYAILIAPEISRDVQKKSHETPVEASAEIGRSEALKADHGPLTIDHGQEKVRSEARAEFTQQLVDFGIRARIPLVLSLPVGFFIHGFVGFITGLFVFLITFGIAGLIPGTGKVGRTGDALVNKAVRGILSYLKDLKRKPVVSAQKDRVEIVLNDEKGEAAFTFRIEKSQDGYLVGVREKGTDEISIRTTEAWIERETNINEIVLEHGDMWEQRDASQILRALKEDPLRASEMVRAIAGKPTFKALLRGRSEARKADHGPLTIDPGQEKVRSEARGKITKFATVPTTNTLRITRNLFLKKEYSREDAASFYKLVDREGHSVGTGESYDADYNLVSYDTRTGLLEFKRPSDGHIFHVTIKSDQSRSLSETTASKTARQGRDKRPKFKKLPSTNTLQITRNLFLKNKYSREDAASFYELVDREGRRIWTSGTYDDEYDPVDYNAQTGLLKFRHLTDGRIFHVNTKTGQRIDPSRSEARGEEKAPAENYAAIDDAMNVFALRRFLREEEFLFHGLVNFFNSPGVMGTEMSRVPGTTPFKKRATKLRDQLRQILRDANAFYQKVKEPWEAGDPQVISAMVRDEFYPLLTNAELFLDEYLDFAFKMNGWKSDPQNRSAVEGELQRSARLSISHDPQSDARQIKENYGALKQALRGYYYDRRENKILNDLNQCALRAMNAGFGDYYSPAIEPAFSKRDPAVMAAPAEVQFTLSSIAQLLTRVAAEANERALETVLTDGSFYRSLASSPRKFLDRTKEGQLFKHIVFDRPGVKMSVSDTGEITFSYQTLPQVYARMAAELKSGNRPLLYAREASALFAGKVEVKTNDARNTIEVTVKVPVTFGTGKSYQDCKALQTKRSKDSYIREPEVQFIKLKRTIANERGPVTYDLQGLGAALLSEKSCENTVRIIKIADEYVAQIPSVNTVEFMATGSSSSIRQAYESGEHDVRLFTSFDENEGDAFKPIRDKRYHYIFEPSQWEEGKADVSPAPELAPPAGDENSVQMRQPRTGLHFNMATFQDRRIMPLVLELSKKADLMQLPVTHDQESRLMEQGEHIRAMGATLKDLLRVLGEVQSRHPHSRLAVQLIPVVAFRVAAVGSIDGIFSLDIYDEQGRMIAHGTYSKSASKFIYKEIDPVAGDLVTKKLMAVLEELKTSLKIPSIQRITFRALDEILAREKITIPDEWSLSLLSALKGESSDPYFGPAKPEDLIRYFLAKPEVHIKVDPKLGIFVSQEENEPVQGEGVWGVILNLDGSEGEQVVTYAQAKHLYETRHQFFAPNERFLQQYQQEKGEAGDNSPAARSEARKADHGPLTIDPGQEKVRSEARAEFTQQLVDFGIRARIPLVLSLPVGFFIHGFVGFITGLFVFLITFGIAGLIPGTGKVGRTGDALVNKAVRGILSYLKDLKRKPVVSAQKDRVEIVLNDEKGEAAFTFRIEKSQDGYLVGVREKGTDEISIRTTEAWIERETNINEIVLEHGDMWEQRDASQILRALKEDPLRASEMVRAIAGKPTFKALLRGRSEARKADHGPLTIDPGQEKVRSEARSIVNFVVPEPARPQQDFRVEYLMGFLTFINILPDGQWVRVKDLDMGGVLAPVQVDRENRSFYAPSQGGRVLQDGSLPVGASFVFYHDGTVGFGLGGKSARVRKATSSELDAFLTALNVNQADLVAQYDRALGRAGVAALGSVRLGMAALDGRALEEKGKGVRSEVRLDKAGKPPMASLAAKQGGAKGSSDNEKSGTYVVEDHVRAKIRTFSFWDRIVLSSLWAQFKRQSEFLKVHQVVTSYQEAAQLTDEAKIFYSRKNALLFVKIFVVGLLACVIGLADFAAGRVSAPEVQAAFYGGAFFSCGVAMFSGMFLFVALHEASELLRAVLSLVVSLGQLELLYPESRVISWVDRLTSSHEPHLGYGKTVSFPLPELKRALESAKTLARMKAQGDAVLAFDLTLAIRFKTPEGTRTTDAYEEAQYQKWRPIILFEVQRRLQDPQPRSEARELNRLAPTPDMVRETLAKGAGLTKQEALVKGLAAGLMNSFSPAAPRSAGRLSTIFNPSSGTVTQIVTRNLKARGQTPDDLAGFNIEMVLQKDGSKIVAATLKEADEKLAAADLAVSALRKIEFVPRSEVLGSQQTFEDFQTFHDFLSAEAGITALKGVRSVKIERLTSGTQPIAELSADTLTLRTANPKSGETSVEEVLYSPIYQKFLAMRKDGTGIKFVFISGQWIIAELNKESAGTAREAFIADQAEGSSLPAGRQAPNEAAAKVQSSSQVRTTGKLFYPTVDLQKLIEMTDGKDFSGRVQALLDVAEAKGLDLWIRLPLRGLDGPGSSLDLPRFQLLLTKQGAKDLSEVTSTPTLASNFYVTVRIKRASNPDAVEYVAPDYGIPADKPHVIVGDVQLENGTTSQKNGPQYIFRNLFKVRGVRIELEEMPVMAMAGGMESSNAFNVAVLAAASMLSGVDLSWADIFQVAVELENKTFKGLTGGQGHLASILGGAARHVWISGIKDAAGKTINPYGAFSVPFLDEAGIQFVEKRMALVQAGKKYKDGKAVVNRTAALINNMWTDLLEDGDPIGVYLHTQKLALAQQYVEALGRKDMKTVIQTVNAYVDIRDALQRRWLRLAMHPETAVALTRREIAELGISETNFDEAKVSANAAKYAKTLATDEVLQQYLAKFGERLPEISLYTQSLDPESVEDGRRLIDAARKRGIAIMPLGAGGPSANMIAIAENEADIEKFFSEYGLPVFNEAESRKIVRGEVSGEHTLRGYLPFKVGREGASFHGLDSIKGVKKPGEPVETAYDTGKDVTTLTHRSEVRTERVAYPETKLRIAMAQMNAKVGDLIGNYEKALAYVKQAQEQDADLVVFPAQALTGAPLQDLVKLKHFVRQSEETLQALAKQVSRTTVVIGFVKADEQGVPRNAVAVLSEGKVRAVHMAEPLIDHEGLRDGAKPQKSFQFDLKGIPVQVTLQEDRWDTMPEDAAGSAKLRVFMSASRFSQGKQKNRAAFLSGLSEKTGAAVVHVNLVGGQDKKVFDGGSLILGKNAEPVAAPRRFEESLSVADIKVGEKEAVSPNEFIKRLIPPAVLSGEMSLNEELHDAIVLAIRDYFKKNGLKKAVLGMSGGMDSALVAALAVDALGKENVIAVSMPTHFNSKGTKNDARRQSEVLGIEFREIPIQGLLSFVMTVIGREKSVSGFFGKLGLVFAAFLRWLSWMPYGGRVFQKFAMAGLVSTFTVADENLQSRLRMIILMHMANSIPGAIAFETGNKSEGSTGYFTLYGDGAGGFAPICDLWKAGNDRESQDNGSVFALARFMNKKAGKEVVLQSIIDRLPSAELNKGQTDEKALMPYPQLDSILKLLVEQWASIHEASTVAGPDAANRVAGLLKGAAFKRAQVPQGPQLSEGPLSGYDLPITNGYKETAVDEFLKSQPRRIGIFGGTFNPITNASLELAEAALKQLGLDEVIFVPSHITPDKSPDGLVPGDLRLQMVREAVRGRSNAFKVSDFEVSRLVPSFTIDTVRHFKEGLPEGSEIFMIVGNDRLPTLPQWHQAPELLKMSKVVVVSFEGDPAPSVPGIEAVPVVVKPATQSASNIHATQVRRMLANGEQGWESMVAPGVAKIIKREGFYAGLNSARSEARQSFSRPGLEFRGPEGKDRALAKVKSRQAFTLVEILIIIAVVGALAWGVMHFLVSGDAAAVSSASTSSDLVNLVFDGTKHVSFFWPALISGVAGIVASLIATIFLFVWIIPDDWFGEVETFNKAFAATLLVGLGFFSWIFFNPIAGRFFPTAEFKQWKTQVARVQSSLGVPAAVLVEVFDRFERGKFSGKDISKEVLLNAWFVKDAIDQLKAGSARSERQGRSAGIVFFEDGSAGLVGGPENPSVLILDAQGARMVAKDHKALTLAAAKDQFISLEALRILAGGNVLSAAERISEWLQGQGATETLEKAFPKGPRVAPKNNRSELRLVAEENVARLNAERPKGYPFRRIKDRPFYESKSVLKNIRSKRNPGGWADPELPNFNSPELLANPKERRRLIEKYRRQIEAIRTRNLRIAPYAKFDQETGLPVLEETGLEGRGNLGLYGYNQAEDALIFTIDPQGEIWILVGDRKGGVAFPGGFAEQGQETMSGVTATRELREETNQPFNMTRATLVFRGPTNDWRDTNGAKVITRAYAMVIPWEDAQQIRFKSRELKNVGFRPVTKDQQYYANHRMILDAAIAKIKGGQIPVTEGAVKAPRVDITLPSIQKAWDLFKLNQHLAVPRSYDIMAPKAPHGGNYMVMAGGEEILARMHRRQFRSAHIEKLKELGIGNDAFYQYLLDFRAPKIDLDALPDGTVVTPDVPLMRLTLNPVQMALLGDLIKNRLNQTVAVATTLARVRQSLSGEFVTKEQVHNLRERFGDLTANLVKTVRALIDYGLRRGPGIGSTLASYAAVVGGAIATSNVRAAFQYALDPSGTMAHFWVLFVTRVLGLPEIEAYRIWGELHPNDSVFLIDTYDTIEAAKMVAIVGNEMKARGHALKGVRLDSGDPAELSRQVREILDKAGLHDVAISISNDMNEYKVHEALVNGARINAVGIGTHGMTGGKQPFLELEVRESKGERWWRGRHKGYITRYITTDPGVRASANYGEQVEELLMPYWRQGKRAYGSQDAWHAHERAIRELDNLFKPSQKSLEKSEPIPVVAQKNPLTINQLADGSMFVDEQDAFTEGGGLAVPGGKKTYKVSRRLMNLFSKRFASLDKHPYGHVSFASSFVGIPPFSILTADAEVYQQLKSVGAPVINVAEWTEENHKIAAHALSLFSLSELKDYLNRANGKMQVLWPDHAEFGTSEAELPEDFRENEFAFIQPKGLHGGTDSYSAFFDNAGNPTDFTRELKARGIKRLFITGIAYDYCVRATIEGALKAGFEVVLIKDGTVAVGVPPGIVEDTDKFLVDSHVIVTTMAEVEAANNFGTVEEATMLVEPREQTDGPDDDESTAKDADFYHFAMTEALVRKNWHEIIVQSDYFFRGLPNGADHVMVSGQGLRRLLTEIDNFRMTDEQLDQLFNYHKKAKAPQFDPAYIEELRKIQKEGLKVTIWGLPAGSVAYPNEPVLSVKGPALHMEILETFILTRENFNNWVGTKSGVIRKKHGTVRINDNGMTRSQGAAHTEMAISAYEGGGIDATTDFDAVMEGVPAARLGDEGIWLDHGVLEIGETATIGGVYKPVSATVRNAAGHNMTKAMVKVSQDRVKRTYPGEKKIVAVSSGGKIVRRVTMGKNERLRLEPGQKTRDQRVLMFQNGKVLYKVPDIFDVRVRYLEQQEIFEGVVPEISSGLQAAQERLIAKIRGGTSRSELRALLDPASWGASVHAFMANPHTLITTSAVIAALVIVSSLFALLVRGIQTLKGKDVKEGSLGELNYIGEGLFLGLMTAFLAFNRGASGLLVAGAIAGALVVSIIVIPVIASVLDNVFNLDPLEDKSGRRSEGKGWLIGFAAFALVVYYFRIFEPAKDHRAAQPQGEKTPVEQIQVEEPRIELETPTDSAAPVKNLGTDRSSNQEQNEPRSEVRQEERELRNYRAFAGMTLKKALNYFVLEHERSRVVSVSVRSAITDELIEGSFEQIVNGSKAEQVIGGRSFRVTLARSEVRQPFSRPGLEELFKTGSLEGRAIRSEVREIKLPADIEAVSGRELRRDQPFLVIKDIHGTELQPTWPEEFMRLHRYFVKSNEAQARAWVKENETKDLVRLLAQQSGIAVDVIRDRLMKIRAQLWRAYKPEAAEGAFSMDEQLTQQGVPIVLMSGSDRAVIIPQLNERSFLDLIPQERIIGRDDILRSQPRGTDFVRARKAAVRSLLFQFPGYTILNFDDGIEVNEAVAEVGGYNFNIPQGEGVVWAQNRERAVRNHADFILTQGFSHWQDLLGFLDVSPARQQAAAQKQVPIYEHPAIELPYVMPAHREGGLALHIDVSNDLGTLTYSAVENDSAVHRRDGTVDFNELRRSRDRRWSFPSSHLMSPLKFIQNGLPAASAAVIMQLWTQNKRYTRYRGITTSWDDQVDRNVWATNIDTLAFHQALEDSDFLQDLGSVEKAAEIGVGGGHVSTLIATLFPGIKELTISDISIYALSTGKRSVLPFLQKQTRLRTFLGQGLGKISDDQDLLVINPPYIPIEPSEKQNEIDPYRGTGLIREITQFGVDKLNRKNPRASVVIDISSLAQKEFDEYVRQFGGRLLIEPLLHDPLRVPLKIKSSLMSDGWKKWLVDEKLLEYHPDAGPTEEPYWHRLQFYRIRLKSAVRSELRTAVTAQALSQPVGVLSPAFDDRSISEIMEHYGISIPGIVKTAREVTDGIVAGVMMKAAAVKKYAQSLLALVMPGRSAGTLSETSAAETRKKAQMLLGIRQETLSTSDVFVLGSDLFLRDHRAAAGIRQAYPQTTITAIVRTPAERVLLENLNRLLAREGLLPVLPVDAQNPAELKAHLDSVRKARGSVRPMALLYGSETIPEALKQQIPNQTTITQKMLSGFMNAMGALMKKLESDLAATFATAKSA
jgi:NAD+ synthase (glutamine-hydrolysing)